MNHDAPLWTVRAGKHSDQFESFLREGIVAIGWKHVGPIDGKMPDEKVDALFAKRYPDEKEGSRRVWAAQVKRFIREIKVGEAVTTYDTSGRVYLLGKITSDVEWRDHDLARVRKVRWERKVGRDALSAASRNALGSIATLFRVSPEARDEMQSLSVPLEAAIDVTPTPDPEPKVDPTTTILRDEVIENAEQFIEDRIVALDWKQMQHLVAGILRAMGYRTRVADEGPDRGVDVFASPDGLGLQEPRIFVEVKHRPGTSIGSQEIRAFLGGRKHGDRCLYVSTGGFTKDAKYEAERASIPLMLLTLADLREQLLDYYEQLDPETRSLVPLQRLYWPVG